MTQLEFEFRVYRTREPGAKRECVVARNVPHAMQVWGESVDAYSRSLELVISGNWLMQLMENVEMSTSGPPTAIDECDRARITELCIDGLLAGSDEQRRRCLEQVLIALGHDLNAIRREMDIPE